MIHILVALVISITAMIVLMRVLDLHPFFALLTAAVLYGLIAGHGFSEIISTMQSGFGSLLAQIGFIVTLGSCLGMVMEKSGAMEVISSRIVEAFGPGKAVLAMTTIGMLVGIPVFCDSGFIILSRLVPSIAGQASVNQASLALALSSGLYTTHVLVPPTPGPLAAAVTYGLSDHLGIMMLISTAASIPVGLVSYFLSKRIGKNIITAGNAPAAGPGVPSLAFWQALLPLVLPILLIALTPVAGMVDSLHPVEPVLKVIGMPVVALSIGLVIGIIPLFHKGRNNEPGKLKDWIGDALKDAGIILLITGAGGSFGAVIKSSGIDVLLREQFGEIQSGGIVVLGLAYVIAAVLKSAQGSSTSSMIITSSLLAPIAATAGFVTPIEYSALAIATGAGAMTVSHANDSYFWVISQFGGIQPRDAFRSFTMITFIQGLTAMICAILIYLLA